MAIERVYNENEVEYLRLKMFADVSNLIFKADFECKKNLAIKTTYYDCGQDWLYSALIMYDFKDGITSYQAFCPRDYKLIVTCDSTAKIKEMAEYYANMQIKNEWNYKNSLYEKFE